jgi:hypothetical protein
MTEQKISPVDAQDLTPVAPPLNGWFLNSQQMHEKAEQSA